jgi:hypothetical protein
MKDSARVAPQRGLFRTIGIWKAVAVGFEDGSGIRLAANPAPAILVEKIKHLVPNLLVRSGGTRTSTAAKDRLYVVAVRIEHEGGVITWRETFGDVAKSGPPVIGPARL